MFIINVPLFFSRNNTIEIHLCLQQLPRGRGFPGSLRHTPPLFRALFISATALAAGHGLPKLLQMDWLAPNSWNMEKMDWSTLIPVSEKENNLLLLLLVIVKQSHSEVLGSAGPGKGMCFGHSFLL